MSTMTETLFTPDDLLTMPDGDQYELVDGHLVERGMGTWAGAVELKLAMLIYNLVISKEGGNVFSSAAGYRCFPKNRVRKPDVSFIAAGRLPDGRIPEGFITVVPDLAVEVVSPTDIQYDVDRKVAEYLAVGVRLVWVVNPDTRHVLIFRLDGTIAGVREGGELDGEGVVPGFRCPVAELFTP